MKNKEEPVYSRALVPKHNTLYKIIIAVLIVVILILLCIYFGLIKPNFNSNVSGEVDVVTEKQTVELDKLNFEGVSTDREIGKSLMKIDYIDNCSFTISYPQIGIEEIDEKIISHASELKNFFNG